MESHSQRMMFFLKYRQGQKPKLDCSLNASPPNPSVNPDAPVRVFILASLCGGAPITLNR
jgi:hypothetical protein